MNLKKFAVRGLIILAVVVALCMFLSGTIRTITTPKVRLTAAKNGRLEEEYPATGRLAYSATEKIQPDVPAGQSVTVTKVNVREGYTVKEGDVLFTAEVTDYQAAMAQYQQAYDKASESLLALEQKSGDIRVRKTDQAYADAYYALRDAQKENLSAKIDMNTLLNAQKLTLPEEGYPEGSDEEVSTAIDRFRASEQALAEAQSAFQKASRYSVDETVWNYIEETRTLQETMQENQEKMEELSQVNYALSRVCAPHDGYVVTLNVKAGDSYDGRTPALELSAQDVSPVVRADVSDIKRTISKGASVRMTLGDQKVESKVASVEVGEDGAKYAVVELTRDMIKAAGSVFSLTGKDIDVTLTYRAKESTTLLPLSAVHGSDQDRYVYVVNRETSTFGSGKMTVQKMQVTVLAEVKGVVSIQEDLGYYTIAYMEDRALNDGDTVMEYTD